MNEPGFSFPPYHHHHHHHLDPRAQEFFPTTGTNIPSLPSNIYYPYPPPIYDNMVHPQPPYEVPPPPLPENLPPSPTTPSRTLFLTMVPPSVSESTIRRDLEIFGDVRAVEMERRRQGLITVHFYDVRDAQTALVAIQQQHMQQQFRLGRHYESLFNNSMGLSHPPPPPPIPTTARGLISGRVVWAQYTTPVTSGLPEGCNQGTLVVFNLDSRVSVPYLKQIFEPFGPVKELRETPRKKNQKFVEFYDVRNAAVAMAEMNGREIYGKSIVVDFSRPGGQSKKLQKGPLIPTKLNNNNNHSPRSSIPSSPSTPPQSRWRKAVGGSGKSTSSSNGSSVQESMSNLCIGSNRKNISFKTSGGGGGGGGGGRPWKGRHGGKEYDPRFLINIEDGVLLSESNSSRTTVMIKNIPNKYSQKLLLNMLDNHCIHCNEQIAADGEDQPLSSYDFVYLPIDFVNKCNVGYGFVNMTSPEATLRLYKAFHHQSWEVFNSRKICEVTYARLQGLEALREHFKNSKFPGDDEEYMPVVFTPARDGRTLTDPLPIVGRAPSPPSSSAKEKNQLEPPLIVGGGGGVNDHDGYSYDVATEEVEVPTSAEEGGCSYKSIA